MPDQKVLLVTPDFPPTTGGIAVLFENLVRSATGLKIRVLTFDEPGAGEFDRSLGLDVRRVARVDMRRQLAVPVLNAAALAEVRRFRPDAILSGHPVASIAAVFAKRFLGIPFVQYLHADEFRVRSRLTGWAAREADAAIAVSAYTREMALAAGVEARRLSVIHPGVDLPSAYRVEREGPPTLLTVATFLSPRKGHDVIVRALPIVRAAIPDVRWVVVGDGPLRSDIERAASEQGLDGAVSFLGRVDDDVRDAWLDRAHVFCMPSRIPPDGIGGEGFGIVYLEAGAHGLPVIGGNVAGALDAIVDGVTGTLVDPTDHEAVADAAIGLLSDPDRAQRLGSEGRAHAEAHAWPRIATQVEALLREVAA